MALDPFAPGRFGPLGLWALSPMALLALRRGFHLRAYFNLLVHLLVLLFVVRFTQSS